jgi:dTDP-4-dehydrorhamnose reductase
MSILVFGRGFIGTRLARDLPGAILAPTDITDRAAVLAAIREHAPTAVINAAGKTGKPNVDWCETHQPETYRGNVVGPLTLADACAEAGVYLLHLASGCIFYGDSPTEGGWLEDDFANPSAFYSRTKYAADLVLSRLPNVGIARLRMPIDGEPSARNLITKLAAYREVVDVANSVTVVDDLVQVAGALAAKRAEGVFHVTNPGVMKHTELLSLYRELVDPSHTYTLITADDLVARGLAAKARSNCVLASPRLAALGVSLRPVDVALRDAMTSYAAAKRNS